MCTGLVDQVTSLQISGRPISRVPCDAIVVPFFANDVDVDGRKSNRARIIAGPGIEELNAAWGTDLLQLVSRDPSFSGAVGDSTLVLAPGSETTVVVAVGVGSEASVDADAIRLAAMTAARRSRGYRRMATTLPQVGSDTATAIRAVAEGFLLGCHDYLRPGAPAPGVATRAPDSVALVVASELARNALVRRSFEHGAHAGRMSSWIRQLVETPGGQLTPSDLAEVLRTRGGEAGVTVKVWSERTMAARGFGATASVGAGSRNRPAVVELRAGSGATSRTLGLAGKGITFDSGGLNLKKDSGEIAWMKSDMAGAAAVAGAVFAAAEAGFDAPIHAILPLAENMPGGNASRPGDVVTHPDGRTTEITDTDCEGRLVLADALAYLAATRPAGIIDVGTLTDGGGVGPSLWGCWATDPTLARELVAAGQIAGEPGWQLPLRPEYELLMRSSVADIVNCTLGTPDSGQMAATYLRTFTGDVPWVHIDNGSSAYLEQEAAPWPAGPTGSPARALLELLFRRST